MTSVPNIGSSIGNLINGEWHHDGAERQVLHKFTGEVLAVAHDATPDVVTAAVTAARAASESPLQPYERFEILRKVADAIARDRERLALEVCRESGLTLKDCLGDTDRAVQTMQISAEEAKRITGEIVPIEAAPGFEHRMAFTLRRPVGVVGAITPFNSPLNTVAHKVGPALAAGNAVVVKPSPFTPIAAATLSSMLLEAGLPPGLIGLVLGPGDPVGTALVADERVDFFTFTGSTATGKAISSRLGMRRATMECGNVSGTIVCADANVRDAAEQCGRGAFRKAGQVCTSVQRIYVHADVYDEFLGHLVTSASALVVGDPEDEKTDIGPMISEAAARRAEEWVGEAVGQGARLVLGGIRSGAAMSPTILTDVPPAARVVCEEIFAPVVSVIPFKDFDEALRVVNDTPYGLQAGVFTRDLNKALEAARRLRVGGVVINATSSTRADLMPYGGVKDSGYGVEGPRYAIREMTEERLVLLEPARPLDGER
ncbi:aldehyde dehydrogenase family protein [Spongiactinospora sp. TRM90649]|uniref:aldehyde dehydrogenase family protein n=1 Tax=Spongiactinospora sp. TRM90649 TaxID=3031114 RepID=UPI0023F64A22|nr:aldehyde dehydrogenase family protein [Spongiactinospora sp. TRM90649]MDF5754319.1 aldehyde dehydrogenase family protein [Spongiactinospora sp. TRM90649]